MSFKKIIIIAFLIFTTVPIYKIYAATPVGEKKTITDVWARKQLPRYQKPLLKIAPSKITAWVVAHSQLYKTVVSQSVTMLKSSHWEFQQWIHLLSRFIYFPLLNSFCLGFFLLIFLLSFTKSGVR